MYKRIVSLFAFLTMAPLLIGEANAQGVAAFDLMPSRDLGVLPGFESGAAAVAINPSGQVVGYSFKYLGELDTHRYHAFFWTEPDGMLDLGTLGGDDSWATDLNAKGQVVGFSTVAPRVFRAFSWTAAGGMVDLGTLPGGIASKAIAVNSSGYVVGFSWAASEEGRHAVLWTPRGEIMDLGTLGGGYSEPHAINAYGQVVGASETSYGERHAFSWTASGGMIDLGTLGGYESWALAVSDSGQVVGGTRTYSGSRAFSWSVRDGMIDLGHLGGGFSAAFGVNASGDVVGYTLNDTHNEVVFRWTKAAGMVAVANGDTGRPIGHPFASDYFGDAPGRLVNATGQVLGYGPFAWSATGGLFNLRGDGAPAALNAQGQIVGWAQYGRATMWQIPPDPLPAVADVYVRGGVWASTNFNEHKLLVKLGNTLDYTRRGYIKFDISDFPTIGTATLRLYGAVSSGTERVRVGVFRVANQSWDESRMTRNKQPSYGPMLGIIKVTSTNPEWVEIDVTAFVRAEQQAGRHVVSVALRALEHTSAFASFDSREAGLSGPQLVITPSGGSASLSN